MRRDFFRSLTEMPILWLGISVLATSIFIADTVTDLEIAFAVLHVSVVLISVRSGQPPAIIAVGIGCTSLTVLSYFLTPRGNPEPGIVNSALSSDAMQMK
ncbi:hypothetical protein FB593_11281 [Rhizobium sp. SJZ105]|uniref:hypothetical protein n=1 Tax=Rhizobium sp. SJZ105 TaxID=2572678 RepID=UPI0011ABFF37|nr:hypothetical protein [Rhizobium sp. SJZ105]TWC78396.1 hypothetical protein FB593_11281 [Rhizobium sp. SJZ105]